MRNIIHALGLILLLLACLIFFRKTVSPSATSTPRLVWTSRAALILFLIVMAFLIMMWRSGAAHSPVGRNEVLYKKDTLYHQLVVTQSGPLRYLWFDNSQQSAINLNNPLDQVFYYTSFLHLGVVAKPQPARALFIGLGGGSAPMKFLHDYPSLQAVDAVEIDPEVVKVARDYFALPEDPRLRVITQDGRLFVEHTGRAIARGEADPYDLVVIDAYSSSTIPYHLTTLEFLQSVRKTLAPDGVVVSNIIGALTGPHSSLFRAMVRTFGAVFPQYYIFPVYGWFGVEDIAEQNIILIATLDPHYRPKAVWQKRAEELYAAKLIAEDVPSFTPVMVDDPLFFQEEWLTGGPLLTDDYAPVDTLKHPLL